MNIENNQYTVYIFMVAHMTSLLSVTYYRPYKDPWAVAKPLKPSNFASLHTDHNTHYSIVTKQ